MTFRIKLTILWLCLSAPLFAQGPIAKSTVDPLNPALYSKESRADLTKLCKVLKQENIGTHLTHFQTLHDFKHLCFEYLISHQGVGELSILRKKLEEETMIILEESKNLDSKNMDERKIRILNLLGFHSPIADDLYASEKEANEFVVLCLILNSYKNWFLLDAVAELYEKAFYESNADFDFDYDSQEEERPRNNVSFGLGTFFGALAVGCFGVFVKALYNTHVLNILVINQRNQIVHDIGAGLALPGVAMPPWHSYYYPDVMLLVVIHSAIASYFLMY